MDITDYRAMIDKVDDEIIRLFRRRMEIIEELRLFKLEKGIAFENSRREEEIKERIADCLPENLRTYAKVLYDSIFNISKDYMQHKTDFEQ